MQNQFKCDGCGKIREYEDFVAAQDLFERIDVGGIFTDVECPDCGALAYPVMSRIKLHIFWGEEPEDGSKPTTYEFNTQQEAVEFLNGVSEGNGWVDYHATLDPNVVWDAESGGPASKKKKRK